MVLPARLATIYTATHAITIMLVHALCSSKPVQHQTPINFLEFVVPFNLPQLALSGFNGLATPLHKSWVGPDNSRDNKMHKVLAVL
jgi:hypothetical protein